MFLDDKGAQMLIVCSRIIKVVKQRRHERSCCHKREEKYANIFSSYASQINAELHQNFI